MCAGYTENICTSSWILLWVKMALKNKVLIKESKKEQMYVYITELVCSPENNTSLQINYTPIKLKY